jgi:biopolymer transport protein ExbB/TolQ
MLAQKLLAVAQVGSSVVLYLLLALSVLSIGLILERWLYFRKRRVDAPALGKQLLVKLLEKDTAGVEKLLKASPAVEAEVLAEAMRWYDRGPAAFEQILAASVKERRKGFESGLLFLGTLGNNAPFIGLFGTVLGVVTAFRELGANATGAMGNVMGGIAEALVATAVGILVALPAVIAYNVFQKKCGDLEENAAALGGIVLAHLKSEPASGNGAAREIKATGSAGAGKHAREASA